MPPKNKGEGTKIAQAAKDLNVTSVTIRRYIAEFDIPTTADENGIKVLPPEAMEELHLIRQLKEDGMTNPKVLEELETHRKAASKASKAEKKTDSKKSTKTAAAEKAEPEKVEVKETKEPPAKKRATAARGRRAKDEEPEEEEQAPAAPAETETETAEPEAEVEAGEGEPKEGEGEGDGRSKHSLTCQTCSKVFEHMNPRLRDCLECYRAKRKERRRGGDKHKNVIQHPLAQQALNKSQQAQRDGQPSEDAPAAPAAPTGRGGREPRVEREPREQPIQVVRPQSSSTISAQPARHQVRNYRKAIEETRTITANLKRRLERPDLPEAERRWLEQIYAYQLILHQGWRHLSEYKAGNTTAGAGAKEKE